MQLQPTIVKSFNAMQSSSATLSASLVKLEPNNDKRPTDIRLFALLNIFKLTNGAKLFSLTVKTLQSSDIADAVNAGIEVIIATDAPRAITFFIKKTPFK